MQTALAPEFQGTPEGEEAQAILRKCVHCGFCTATCPTYQLLGDELDGPRGRIYLIKQVLEGQAPTRATQLHLDRCLSCRNCESTCPSGVQYGRLVDIGRAIVDDKVARPPAQRAVRWALGRGLPSPLFAPALRLGQAVRGLLPDSLRAKVPAPQAAGAWPTRTHARQVLLLAGCVQPAMAPNINAATARVLDAAGIACVLPPAAGCCGALKFHLDDPAGGRAQMRANIDAWWPYIEAGTVEAIVMNASGCGLAVREYGQALAHDAAYAAKARRVSELTRDLGELLPALVPALKGRVDPGHALDRLTGGRQEGASAASPGRPACIAYHPPCTLQHGQKLRGGVEAGLRALGFDIRLPDSEAHLCCGSAGTYSVLQPAISRALRDRKLQHLQQLQAQGVATANIGCITHLQSGTGLPVRHWVEWLDAAMVPA